MRLSSGSWRGARFRQRPERSGSFLVGDSVIGGRSLPASEVQENSPDSCSEAVRGSASERARTRRSWEPGSKTFMNSEEPEPEGIDAQCIRAFVRVQRTP